MELDILAKNCTPTNKNKYEKKCFLKLRYHTFTDTNVVFQKYVHFSTRIANSSHYAVPSCHSSRGRVC